MECVFGVIFDRVDSSRQLDWEYILPASNQTVNLYNKICHSETIFAEFGRLNNLASVQAGKISNLNLQLGITEWDYRM